MAPGIKSLAKDTAIYGLSSMVGRFLNWLLVPLYTYTFASGEYGIVTELYAVVAIFLVILTYGMETGFFRFANHERWSDPMQVYTTALLAIVCSSTIFVGGLFLGLDVWSRWLDCANHPSYIWMLGVTVALDAFTSLPFAYLRYQRRPVRFALLKISGIGLNIFFNLFFICLLPRVADHPAFSWMVIEDFSVGYIFLANLISSVITLFLVLPELKVRWSFSGKLLREMLNYSFPLLILGLAGIMNQSIDKIIYPHLAEPAEAMSGLGIYGANYKIAIIMVMFLQAFRFAYEPLIFAINREGREKSQKSYSDAMKWFIVFAMFIFVSVMMLLDIVRYFISPVYFEGLKVVPIVMLAELFFGIFFNLSVWYKVSDRTYWGTLFTVLGLAVTLGLNAWFIPIWGYMGCAWAAFGCYAFMMFCSWIVGRWKHPIDYDLKSVFFYIGLGVAIWLGVYAAVDNLEAYPVLAWLIKIAGIALYVLVVLWKENLTATLRSLTGRLRSQKAPTS